MSIYNELLGKIVGGSSLKRKVLHLISGSNVDLSVEDGPETEVSFDLGMSLTALTYSLQHVLPRAELDSGFSGSGLAFQSDGSRMFVSNFNEATVSQYDLSTPWDVTTSVFVDSFSVASQDGNPAGIAFQADGSRMFVMGSSNDSVYQYDLSTSWDVTTAVFDDSFSVAGQDNLPNGLSFRPDGLRMFVGGLVNATIYQYDLSTPWDVTTSVFVDSFSVLGQGDAPAGIAFQADGSRMFVSGFVTSTIYQYDLSTPWDVTTSVFVDSFPTASDLFGVVFSDSGLKLYTVHFDGVVREYFSNIVSAL